MIDIHARYTVVLKTLLDNDLTHNAIQKSLSTYPLYHIDKDYDLIPTREEINNRLLRHYKYREIGFETVGRFVDELEIAMCEIMPYYNELFKTVVIMADLESPFDNVDFVETFEQETERESTTSASGTTAQNRDIDNITTSETDSYRNTTNKDQTSAESTNNKDGSTKYLDTPQNNFSNINNYLSNAQNTTEDQSAVYDSTTDSINKENITATESVNNDTKEKLDVLSSSNGNTEEYGKIKHTFTKKGNHGVNTYAHDINEFRTSIMDVVDRIVHDKRIAELFMLVY